MVKKLVIGIFILLVILQIVPVKEVWLSDVIIHGDKFCYPDGCEPTAGKYTMRKLTTFELIKYRNHIK